MNRPGDWTGPISGIAFLVLLFLSFVVGGEPPDADGATDEVVAFWSDHEAANMVAAALGALAAAAAVWFGASIRAALRSGEAEGGRSPLVAFAGFLTVGLGAAMWSAFQYAAADTAGDVPPEVTQTLAVLVEWYFIPFVVGMVLAFSATGLAILRHGGLPRWLGYLALPIPILFFTPAYFLGLIGATVFILATSYALAASARGSAAAPS